MSTTNEGLTRAQAPALAAMVARIARYRRNGGRLRALAKAAQVSERVLHKWIAAEAHDAYTETLAQVGAALDAADLAEQRGGGQKGGKQCCHCDDLSRGDGARAP
jgi:hypothetical protein